MTVGSRIDGTRRLWGVHQASYEHFIGPIPEGKEVGHTCHVRDCWNPDHLEAQTREQNMQDLSPKGLRQKQETMREIQKLRWAA